MSSWERFVLALLVIAAAAAFYIFVYVVAAMGGFFGLVCLFAAAYCLLHTFTWGWPVIKNWLDSGKAHMQCVITAGQDGEQDDDVHV